jgi:hypothetical protein
VGTVRESLSIEWIESLNFWIHRSTSTPCIFPARPFRPVWGGSGKKVVSISPEMIEGYDYIIVATYYTAYTRGLIATLENLIVGTRGGFRKFASTGHAVRV